MRRARYSESLAKDLVRNRYLYLMAVPVLLYYVLFSYWPMFGALIAFTDFRVSQTIPQSIRESWVGVKHFVSFFKSVYFGRVVGNTLILNGLNLLFGFPLPIVLALMLNEVRNRKLKSMVQTITYLPYFMSMMIIAGMIVDFCGQGGFIKQLAAGLGSTDNVSLLMKPRLFRPIYIVTEIWQFAGWQSIVYLSAITAVNPELYEAARMDGANRWRQTWHVTLSGIMPTIVILLILQIGNIMNIGFEKIFLLYNQMTYSTADVISTFVYRRGLQEASYSFATAVGLFNSCINALLLWTANAVSRRAADISLW
jgi:putative aldouronate transport system permease protein